MVHTNLYILKTSSCHNLLNWKNLIKKWSPHKIQAIQKYFINTTKKSKQFHFTRLFQDLKNMWRGRKKIISSNNSNHIFPTAITVNKETITNSSDIWHFDKVAIDIQFSIWFSKKKYYDYLPPINIESFFITAIDSTEVSNVISSLNQDKSDGPSSIPIKILKLLNKDISDQLAILFNQSFSSRKCFLKTSFENQ